MFEIRLVERVQTYKFVFLFFISDKNYDLQRATKSAPARPTRLHGALWRLAIERPLEFGRGSGIKDPFFVFMPEHLLLIRSIPVSCLEYFEASVRV